MSINIGDNFSYLGKKFLDSRQSFPTIDAMNACTDVPVGFITFCEEDGERYEYRDGSWKILTISSSGSSDNTGGSCDGSCCDNIVIPEGGTDAVIQEDEPDDTSVIWFDPEEDKPYQNDPYISELKEIIKIMTKQIQALTTRVEYLENVVAGSVIPDKPIIPDNPIEDDDYLLLEDGTPLLLEDGEPFLLEIQITNTTTEDYILLEDGTPLLLENGEEFLLEKQTINTINQNELLLENGTPLLLENGESFLLER